MNKIRYEIDPFNRLVWQESGKDTLFPEFRRVIDGRFKIDKKNELVYNIKTPLKGSPNVPSQVRFKGSWSLNEDHRLVFNVDRKERQLASDKVVIDSQIIDAKGDYVLFSVSTQNDKGKRSTYGLKLDGSWKADEHNRLNFQIARDHGKYDELTFGAGWEINKNHEIIYRYETKSGANKKSSVSTLVLKGRWNITERDRVAYEVSGGAGSTLDFRANYAKFEGNFIKYEIGAGYLGDSYLAPRVITLFGKWRLRRNAGIEFDVKYSGGKVEAITFGAEAALKDVNTVSFKLRNDINKKDLGVQITLTRKLLGGDGELFAKAISSKKEKAVYIGAGVRW